MNGRRSALLLVVLLVSATALAGAPAAGAALAKPTYGVGDRWLYDLRGSIDQFPGTNGSDVGTFSFGLVGRVDVAIAGTESVIVNGSAVPAVRVDTRASGFLNGTFSAPPGGPPGTVTVTGSFSSVAEEWWETRAYLSIASNSTTTYFATVSYIVPIDLSMIARVNATTDYAAPPPFELRVGESAATAFTMGIVANTTVTFFGGTTSSENATTVSGNWTRDIVAETNVTVDAGTFAAFQMNQTLSGFPGLAGVVPSEGANETAFFSNSVGYYVRRDAYANGTRVAEMTLQSHSYGARPTGLSLVEISLLVLIPIVALLLIAVWFRGRKKRADRAPEGEAHAR